MTRSCDRYHCPNPRCHAETGERDAMLAHIHRHHDGRLAAFVAGDTLGGDD